MKKLLLLVTLSVLAVVAPQLTATVQAESTAFYVHDKAGRDTVTFTSEAPLEDIIGTTNKISGYVMWDPENPTATGTGQFVVPVDSLNTGIPMRDQHLQSEQWLNAEANPELKLEISGISDVKMVKETEEFKTYELTMSGKFSMNGVTSDVSIPGRITYMPESDKTRTRLPGNLLAGRADFTVSLSAHNVKAKEGVIGSKVAENIEVEVSFVATDEKPEGAMNPCGDKAMNPCGDKAMNPCGDK